MAILTTEVPPGEQFLLVLPSAERSDTPDSQQFHADRAAQGLIVVADVTAIAAHATPSITVTIQGVDPVTDKTWDILASAPITDVSTSVLRVAVSLADVVNKSTNDLIPTIFRIVVDHATDTDALTYAVSAQLIYI